MLSKFWPLNEDEDECEPNILHVEEPRALMSIDEGLECCLQTPWIFSAKSAREAWGGRFGKGRVALGQFVGPTAEEEKPGKACPSLTACSSRGCCQRLQKYPNLIAMIDMELPIAVFSLILWICGEKFKVGTDPRGWTSEQKFKVRTDTKGLQYARVHCPVDCGVHERLLGGLQGVGRLPGGL
ncbi:hypothetical protein CRG98_000738 [Punica granatum]|uniref:Uncharacterized protein n=1 Tax=Punica granatum TaxID=22663 RepID=A0A2I0LDX0_PUNGR|nr:hypothetical protein CRG98_000738 [Punica granatum]